ncbi:MAG: hypothetical protein ACPG4T_02660 [Nannocystaceae bacterium]
MTPERRMQRLLGHLPRALREGANIRHFLHQVAGELTLAEQGLTGLMRSRWYRLACGWENPRDTIETKVATELGGVASLFGIEPLSGESTSQFRRRLRWLVELHSEGLTTAPALLQLAATVYLPDGRPKIHWEGNLAVATLTIKTQAGPREIRLELRDNPSLQARYNSEGLAPGTTVEVVNAGLDAAMPEIHVSACDQPVVLPQFTHQQSDLRIVYLGTLAPEQTLVLRHSGPPELAGKPVDVPVVVYNPYTFNEDEARFAFTRTQRGKSVLAGGRFSIFEPQKALPALPTGVSHWTYTMIESATIARYLRSWPGVEKIPKTSQAGLSKAAINLEMRWQESLAACFELRVPPVVPLHMGTNLSALTSALMRMLDYGRAAGVQARLTLAHPAIAENLAPKDPFSIDVKAEHRESFSATDRLTNVALELTMADHLSPAASHFYASGTFDNRTFDAALFDDPDDPGDET